MPEAVTQMPVVGILMSNIHGDNVDDVIKMLQALPKPAVLDFVSAHTIYQKVMYWAKKLL